MTEIKVSSCACRPGVEMYTQPKPWQANTTYTLEDRVTIRIEEKVIFVLRCIRGGHERATTNDSAWTRQPYFLESV